uniref:Uncharacterized protein n=1 Tax=Timema douglasi TaxID=61478 RepID=A0A7R8V8G2_TIMDO|nr:unnamed protein product [Timema douglasi]
MKSRDSVFDPKYFQIVCEAVGLERDFIKFLTFSIILHGDSSKVHINIKMTTHNKMASPSWLNEKFIEQALREGRKDPKISVKHIDIKMATNPEMAKILEKVELEDYHSLSAEGLFSTNVPERILILQDLAEQGFKLDRSHKGFDLKQSMPSFNLTASSVLTIRVEVAIDSTTLSDVHGGIGEHLHLLSEHPQRKLFRPPPRGPCCGT